VVNVVSRTFVPGRYRRDDSKGSTGLTSNEPPRPASRIAPQTLGESKFGRHSQSMAPSAATSAQVRPSPMMA
jgi:hypothetical protein